MDEEIKINDKLKKKLKMMKFSLLPCGLKYTQFFFNMLPLIREKELYSC
jgi:hypothetical protein